MGPWSRPHVTLLPSIPVCFTDVPQTDPRQAVGTAASMHQCRTEVTDEVTPPVTLTRDPATVAIGVVVAKEHPGASGSSTAPAAVPAAPTTASTTTTTTTAPPTTTTPSASPGSTAPTTTTLPPTTTTTLPPTTTTTLPVVTSGGTSR